MRSPNTIASTGTIRPHVLSLSIITRGVCSPACLSSRAGTPCMPSSTFSGAQQSAARCSLHHPPRYRRQAQWQPRSSSGSSSAETPTPPLLLDHLQRCVDGFDAAAAAAAHPELQDLVLGESASANLAMLASLAPRILASLLSRHPRLLLADLAAWREFLSAFGFDDAKLLDLLRARPEVFYSSSIYAAGELLLFLRADIQLPAEQLPGCIAWAADLPPAASRADMAAVVACLRTRVLPSDIDSTALLQLLSSFPALLGWHVQQQLLPRLEFLEGLGAQGQQLLHGTMYDHQTGWFQGLRSWSYAVAPKLALLQHLLGSEAQACALIQSHPAILKLPVNTKLRPVLEALAAAGLDRQQLAQLLHACPLLLEEPRDSLVSRINFLQVVGYSTAAMLQYPPALLAPLADVTGPRVYFLARTGRLAAFTDGGALQLRRLLEPDLGAFLADAAQVPLGRGSSAGRASSYAALATEWHELLGWCAEKAFAARHDEQAPGLYRQQLILFDLLIQ